MADSFSQSLRNEDPSEELFAGVMKLLSTTPACRVRMPPVVTRSAAALKLALDHQMIITHEQVVDLLAPGGKEPMGLWKHYTHCYPAPAARTPGLKIALQRDLFNLVKKFLLTGADVNGTDAEGNTVLHCLGSTFFPDLLPLLLSHGAAVETRNNAGMTPLLALACSGAAHPEYLAGLVRHGADILVSPSKGCNIFSAGKLSWLSALQEFKLKPIPIEFIQTASRSGSHLLSQLGPEDIVALFTYLDYQDWELRSQPALFGLLFRTPRLFYATTKYICAEPAGHQYARAALRVLCANLNRVVSLGSLAISHLISVIKLCGTDVNRVGELSRIPLLHACAAGAFPVVSALLAQGADPCFKSKNGETSLLLLARSRGWSLPGAEETAQQLVAAVERSVSRSSILEAADPSGKTAITICIEIENLKFLRHLLGATVWSLSDTRQIIAVLAASVSRAMSLRAVLGHLKQVLSLAEFESSMRLVLDENEGLNVLEKACALKNKNSIETLLSLASQAYGEDLLNRAKATNFPTLPALFSVDSDGETTVTMRSSQ